MRYVAGKCCRRVLCEGVLLSSVVEKCCQGVLCGSFVEERRGKVL